MSTEEEKGKEVEDIFERAFGKAPESGYIFRHVEVEVVDNDCFKGLMLKWSAQGIGFGEVWLGWGLDMVHLKEHPNQQGFHTDTEHMSEEFMEALLKEAAPKIAKVYIEHDRSPREGSVFDNGSEENGSDEN